MQEMNGLDTLRELMKVDRSLNVVMLAVLLGQNDHGRRSHTSGCVGLPQYQAIRESGARRRPIEVPTKRWSCGKENQALHVNIATI